MITAGIDCGSQNTKGVLLKDGKVITRAKITTEFDANNAAKRVYETLLTNAGICKEDVESIATTGVGRNIPDFVNTSVNEVISAARGTFFEKLDTKTVIDMGAESSRVIKLNEDGTVKKYEVNDKCASGAGVFIEAMARALQIKTEEMGDYSLRHTKEITTNAQCVVFAESEVISLIHRQETKEDIAYGIHVGICNRVASLIRRLGVTDNVTLIGGPGNNKGLAQCMGKVLGKEIFVPNDTDYVSAVGAAFYALENA